jgi:hypothetical protein
MKRIIPIGLLFALLVVASSNVFAGETKAVDDKIHIKNNTGAKIIGLWVSLNDNKKGDPDWEHNLVANHPLDLNEAIDVAAYAGEHCYTYIFGVAANGDWWYVEQDTCANHAVTLADHKGDGKKATSH